MPAEVVNLRRARKAKGRTARLEEAERNRARTGQPLHERKHEAALRELAARRLDQKQRGGDGTDE